MAKKNQTEEKISESDSSEKSFTLALLVSFGNYLLRKDVIHAKSTETRHHVTDSDIQNWMHEESKKEKASRE